MRLEGLPICARSKSRFEVQWRDCVEIAAINDLDDGYMRQWAAEIGVREDLAELLGDDA